MMKCTPFLTLSSSDSPWRILLSLLAGPWPNVPISTTTCASLAPAPSSGPGKTGSARLAGS